MTTFSETPVRTTSRSHDVAAMTANVPATIEAHRARLKSLAVDGGAIAYLEEGPGDGEVVLLLHGMPTSSWLWRKVVPGLASAGLRVVAPDLLGYGASQKPADVGSARRISAPPSDSLATWYAEWCADRPTVDGPVTD